MLSENIKVLQNYEAFGGFVECIVQMREEAIKEMHSCSVEQLQQISGRILALDEILEMCNVELLRKRFPNI
jgi:hypothetical protein